ncbi:MAG: hypothetical protein ACKOGA_06720 [Planctomycetaceae bacterium]
MIRSNPRIWFQGCLLVGTWLLVTGTCWAGQIRWTGTARYFYVEGTDYDTAPALGTPLFTAFPPTNTTRVFPEYPGLSFQLALTASGMNSVRLRAGVLPAAEARVVAPAGPVPVQVESRKRVVIEADYQITQSVTVPTTLIVDTSAGGGATGAVTNTLGQIDEAESELAITLSESTTVVGADLLSGMMTRAYHNLDGVDQPTPDPLDFSPQQLIDRHNGIYKLRVEVDLRARTFGNVGEERASATWNQMFDMSLTVFDFSGTAPEPGTGGLVLVAAATGGLWWLGRRRSHRGLKAD